MKIHHICREDLDLLHMVAKMMVMSHDVVDYENIEGGHGGAADNKQQAFMDAPAHTFLWKQLK